MEQKLPQGSYNYSLSASLNPPAICKTFHLLSPWPWPRRERKGRVRQGLNPLIRGKYSQVNSPTVTAWGLQICLRAPPSPARAQGCLDVSRGARVDTG